MDKWSVKLICPRANMMANVSVDNHDDGREFVRLEFGDGGYIELALDNDSVDIVVYDAEGDVIGFNAYPYTDLAPKESE
jgi:hypothetical protein